jgi:AAA domain (dynein-related subfamily)
MFAVILQEGLTTPQGALYGIRQYAIIPQADGTIRKLVRDGKNLRGRAGAWQTSAFVVSSNKAVGFPVAVPITGSDYEDLKSSNTPTVLVQKLVRTVKDMNDLSTEDFVNQYNEVYEAASNNPSALSKYLGAPASAVAVSPTVQVVQQPVVEPVLEYVELPPVPTYSSVAPSTFEATREQYGLIEEPYTVLTESEPVMQFSTVVPSKADSHAVLTVPDVQPYYERKFFSKSERDIYDTARMFQENVLLTGDAGTGKTSSARNYAATNNLPFVTIECTQQIDQSITQGRFVPTGEGNSTRWKYSQLATAIQQPSVILINELTRMSPKAASLFLRLLEERELLIEPLNEVIKVHPGVLFIADQNTGIGYTGTSKQDAALVDRFNIKLEFHYDINIEKNFIKSPTLLAFATNIREASELNDEFSVPMSTRLLKNFVAQASRLNFEFAVNSMLSNYPKMDGERDAIKMRFDADVSQIADELGVSLGGYTV